MEILVVAKESNYEIHGSRVEDYVRKGRLDRAILDRLLVAHEQHYKTVESVQRELKQAGLPYLLLSRKDAWPNHKEFSIIITVGGDGTILFSAQHLIQTKARVIGVRSTQESVGFLCSYDFGHENRLVEDVVHDRVNCQPVHRMAARIRFADERPSADTLPVLNDFLFSNANPALTTRYLMKFAGHGETQRSSGVWVSTAVGSTAAIQAAGGMIEDYRSDRLQFRPRELFRPAEHNSLLEGSFFDPATQSLTIENYCESAILALDGQHGTVSLSFGDLVEFRRAPPIFLAIGDRLRHQGRSKPT